MSFLPTGLCRSGGERAGIKQMTSDPEQIVLGVDLDGVCADFYGHIREVAAEWFEVRWRS